jgi:hypothetical protein
MEIPTQLNRITMEFIQEADSNDESQDTQMITVTVEPVLLGLHNEGEGSHYYYIKTERWAFDDIDELIAILQQVKNTIPAPIEPINI